jgi:dephospho-CoA kinase
MKILGLTGSVGMGKSTAAAMLRRMRVPVFDADGAVHHLLGRGGAAVAPVAAAFPGFTDEKGGIDRRALGARVFGDRPALARLEAILHPRVAMAERRFVRQARARHARAVVLDVPLLYESRGERRCDAVIVVWAPAAIQRARVLKRPGMTEARLAFIRSQQVSEREKRRRADMLVPSGLGRARTWRALRRAVRTLGRGEGDGGR